MISKRKHSSKPRVKRTKPRVKRTKPRVKRTKPRIKRTKPRIKGTKPRIKRTKPRIKRTKKSARKKTEPCNSINNACRFNIIDGEYKDHSIYKCNYTGKFYIEDINGNSTTISKKDAFDIVTKYPVKIGIKIQGRSGAKNKSRKTPVKIKKQKTEEDCINVDFSRWGTDCKKINNDLISQNDTTWIEIMKRKCEKENTKKNPAKSICKKIKTPRKRQQKLFTSKLFSVK